MKILAPIALAIGLAAPAAAAPVTIGGTIAARFDGIINFASFNLNTETPAAGTFTPRAFTRSRFDASVGDPAGGWEWAWDGTRLCLGGAVLGACDLDEVIGYEDSGIPGDPNEIRAVGDPSDVAFLVDVDATGAALRAYARYVLPDGESLAGAAARYMPSADVAPVPLPAAGWLMLAGLGGIGLTRRIRGRASRY